jgi:hypothetical protein
MKEMHSRPGASLDPSTGFLEAELSHPENHESVPSLLTDVMEAPSFDGSSSPVLAYPDEFIAGPLLASSVHDGHPDGHSSSVRPPAETIFSYEAMMSSTDPRPCSAPEQLWKSPEANTSRVDTCLPLPGSITGNSRSSELPDTNATPDKSVSTSSPPDESDGIHQLPFPQPPPEVATLLTVQSVGQVVSPVIARNSPLVPWKLPSELGHFWLGLFKISEVKVTHACHRQETDLTSLWVCLFARWIRVRREAPQTHLQRSIPGALFWNGCLVARIYSWMMSMMTIMNGPSALCGHGGS